MIASWPQFAASPTWGRSRPMRQPCHRSEFAVGLQSHPQPVRISQVFDCHESSRRTGEAFRASRLNCIKYIVCCVGGTFSSKGFNFTEIKTDLKVVGLAKNSFGLRETKVDGNIEEFSPSLIQSGVKSNSIDKSTGKVTIADADIVVSGGRV